MNVTGYYGKLPQRGDFVTGRIPGTFKSVWDDWAQQLVKVSELVANNDTANPWFKLPIYRFYLSKGIAGDDAWVGLMLPSQDSVGRKFPLCFARSTNPQCTYPKLMHHEQDFFTHLEKMVTSLFANEFDFELIREKLTQLDSDIPTYTNNRNHSISIQSEEPSLCVRLVTPADENNNDLWESAFDATLRAACSAYSVWQTSPLSHSTHETLVCEALPSMDSCKSLFDGKFQQNWWTQNNRNDPEHREENKLGSLRHSGEVVEDDTIPQNKQQLHQPGETDILDLDDATPLDAPWET